MRPSEYREKTDDELDQLLRERSDDVMHFRMQKSTGVVDNTCASREARKDIARIKTILNERRRAKAQAASGETA